MPANVVITNNFRIVLIGLNYSQDHRGYTVLQHVRFFFHTHFSIFLPSDVQMHVLAKYGNVTAKALGGQFSPPGP